MTKIFSTGWICEECDTLNKCDKTCGYCNRQRRLVHKIYKTYKYKGITGTAKQHATRLGMTTKSFYGKWGNYINKLTKHE